MSLTLASGAGTAVAELVGDDPINDLGPGRPDKSARGKLEALTPEKIVASGAPADRQMASACCAGLWLLHDFLEESHQISQSLHTAEGSFWHGIMHRREPDYSNAGYWFRRVGDHPVFGPLGEAAARIAAATDHDASADYLAEGSGWDPFAFIDLCEAAYRGRSENTELCQKVQQAEWFLLFNYCLSRAAGEPFESGD